MFWKKLKRGLKHFATKAWTAIKHYGPKVAKVAETIGSFTPGGSAISRAIHTGVSLYNKGKEIYGKYKKGQALLKQGYSAARRAKGLISHGKARSLAAHPTVKDLNQKRKDLLSGKGFHKAATMIKEGQNMASSVRKTVQGMPALKKPRLNNVRFG